jgi:mRNA interferase RelE/StbE
MYKLVFSSEGKKSIASLDKDIAQRVLDKLKWLIQDIDNIPLIPLSRNLSGFYKLRVGDWRVIYDVNHKENVVTVHKVGHRKEIYR